MAGLRCQADKPKDDKPAGVPAYHGSLTEWQVLGPLPSVGGDNAIAEEFVKRPDHGAFAVIMNSRYGWFDPANAFIFSGEFQKALFDNLLDQGHEDIGAANQLAKHDLVGSVETTGSMTYRWCYFEITLFGDPHLRVLNPAPRSNISSSDSNLRAR
jgi:hypothetical protein